MKKIRTLLAACAIVIAGATAALAQSGCSTIAYGVVLTPGQWNACFGLKQDALGYVPVNRSGDTMQGKLTFAASTTNNAAISIPQGAVPTSPNNGDVWTTTVGMFVQINGATVGPLASTAGPITFTGQITTQGLTTTSPGWYTQITGDTFARVRVGLNATDVASIAFGPGNAARDAFVERVGPGALRFGAPDAASPVAQTQSVQNVVAGTSNTAGANRTIAGSQGTGTGAGGSILLQVAPAGSSGSAQNALSTAVTIDSTLRVTHAGATTLSGAITYGGVTLTNAVTGTGRMVLDSASTIAGLTVTGSFTATGLVTNADLANPSTTVNGQTCTLGSTCTITATAASITVGTTTISGSATNRLLYNNGGTLGDIAAVNNAVLATNGSGAPSEVTTLPSALTIPSPTFSGTLAGNVTVSGNNTYSGTALHTGAAFTLTTNGQATIGASATLGGIFSGQGSTSDITLQNKSGATVASVATGTTTFNAIGLAINGTSVNTAVSTTQYAAVKIDNSTITVNGSGQLQATGAAATTVTLLTTTVSGGTNADIMAITNSGCAGTTPCMTQVALTASKGIALSGTANSTIATQDPTPQILTSGTDATYTTPANTSYLEILAQGPGGGGGGGGSGGVTGATPTSDTCFGTNATACTTPLIRATAGTGGANGAGGALGVPGTCSVGGTAGAFTGNAGGVTFTPSAASINGIGGPGGASPMFGGAGYANPTGSSVAATANSGAGGAGGITGSVGQWAGQGGGSGGLCRHIITSPAGSYKYTIGPSAAGGAGGAGGVNGNAGSAGGTGVIIIIAH